MRPLRYSINLALDGCCDHRVIPADEESHRYWADNLQHADALLLGREQEPGRGLFVGGVTLTLALAGLGLIDEALPAESSDGLKKARAEVLP